ncbi:helix-turn-helix transcriptional regulator [Komagataeibacter nataicola]|nr:helix-turn-helix domain-containing protein [Komagataeibacter nataicola]
MTASFYQIIAVIYIHIHLNNYPLFLFPDGSTRFRNKEELLMVPPNTSRRLLKIQEVMQETGLGRTSIWRLVKDGKLVKVKIGSNTRITAESYNAWLKNLPRVVVA